MTISGIKPTRKAYPEKLTQIKNTAKRGKNFSSAGPGRFIQAPSVNLLAAKPSPFIESRNRPDKY